MNTPGNGFLKTRVCVPCQQSFCRDKLQGADRRQRRDKHRQLWSCVQIGCQRVEKRWQFWGVEFQKIPFYFSLDLVGHTKYGSAEYAYVVHLP